MLYTAEPCPAPIRNEAKLMRSDATPLVVGTQGDFFNLTTGDCHVARYLDGFWFDTSRSLLVAGVAITTPNDGFALHRLYRAEHLAWFVLEMQWWGRIGFRNDHFIHPLPDAQVVNTARSPVGNAGTLRFLLDWYVNGWIPRNDVLARAWAEEALSPTDCDLVLEGITSLPPYPG